MRRRTLLAGLTAGITSLAGCVNLTFGSRVERSFDREVPVRDASALALTVTNGDVSIEGDGGDTVRLEGTKWARGDESVLDRLGLQVDREDDLLRIDGNEEDFSRPVGIDVDATIPNSLPVRRAATTNGDVTLRSVSGDGLTVKSSNGEILLESVDAAPKLETVNGDVTARGLSDLASVKTTNGAVDLDLDGLGADARIGTTNGDVEVGLGGIDARIVARTTNGEVSIQGLDVTIDSVGDRRVEGTIGEGGPTLRIETVNGDVRIVE
jgi:hypothetical protein